MGLPSRIALHAWHRHGPDRRDDRGQAAQVGDGKRGGRAAGCLTALLLAAAPAASEIRIATFNTELQRDGPGLFLRDVRDDGSADIAEAAARIARAGADVIVLQGIDYDLRSVALSGLRDRIAEQGVTYAHLFALRPNTGRRTGIDLDGDGFADGARDAQGYGSFAGQGGMAILSLWPVTDHDDFSATLWRDLPGSLIPEDDPGHAIQLLSSVGHWRVTVSPPDAPPIHLLAFHATPPVFDGPEDRNGRRNHDEVAFWRAYLDGALNVPPPNERFVLLGDANLDPADGDGRRDAILRLIADPRLQDPRPSSERGTEKARSDGGPNARHTGDPALDTADWDDADGPGNLRVDYVLPSRDWSVAASGVLWPDASGGEARGSRHGLVWVDLR